MRYFSLLHASRDLKFASSLVYTCVKLAMVLCCFVAFGCSKRSGRDKDDSFYRIPKVVSNKGPELLSRAKEEERVTLKLFLELA